MDRDDRRPGPSHQGHQGRKGPLPWEEPATGRTVGDFTIGEPLAEGGYGIIYHAEQRPLGRDVVVKVMRWQGSEDDENTQRFLREAQLAARLDHPYAAHIYAFGTEPDGLLWIAMEYVRGTPLKHVLASQGSLSLARFVPFFEKICEVIYTAHQQGIVHRDIKPSNVMVLSRAGRLLPKLLDLGIARVIDDWSDDDEVTSFDGDLEDAPPKISYSDLSESGVDTITARGISLGSPPYMAPEQWIAASRADARTDQYALAILAYEAITGKRPFQAPDPTSMAVAHARKPVPSLGSGFPGELDEVVKRALSKRAKNRYGDVLHFARAFRAAAGLEAEVEADPLPRLGVPLRDAMLARSPQPLADSVALLEAARSPKRALEAAFQVIRVSFRLLGLLAVAACTRLEPGEGEDGRAARDALRLLRKNHLDSDDWLEISIGLTRRFVAKPDAHPIPELVLLLTPQESGSTDSTLQESAPDAADFSDADATMDTVSGASQILKPRRGGRRRSDELTPTLALLIRLAAIDDEHSSEREALATGIDMHGMLGAMLPDIGLLLTELAFLCDYRLVVRREDRFESWMGARRSARTAVAVQSRGDALLERGVALIGGSGELLLALGPLFQLLAPAPGADDEIFLFDGPSRFGARLVAFPVGFERHDTTFWDWYRKHLVDLDRALDEDDDGRDERDRGPYKGLSAFSPADADDFFGRELEVSACINRLRVMPLLAVVGPSGAGKSSFVQAGIIPGLPENWRALTVRPGQAPLAQLVSALSRADWLAPAPERTSDDNARKADLRADLWEGLEDEPQRLGHILRQRATAHDETLVIIVDQFEELLTLCSDSEERYLYARVLMDLGKSSMDPIRVILTLRDDFLLRTQQIPALRDRLSQALQLLTTPPPDELERILVEPAKRAGYDFDDPDLPGEMVREIADAPGALALLSFTAFKLWELRDRHFHRLQRRAYERLGGVGGALAQHAEDTLAAMSEARRALVREAFRHLVTAEGTRAVLNRSELGEILATARIRMERSSRRDNADVTREVSSVLEALISARLVVASDPVNRPWDGATDASARLDGPRGQPDDGGGRDGSDNQGSGGASGSAGSGGNNDDERGDDRIEVVHEALLSSWPRLVTWRHEDAESARLRDQLRAATRQWVERDRPSGLLWRDDALLEYRLWRRRYQGSLTVDEEDFARTSEHQEARGQRRRRALSIAAFTILLGVVAVVSLLNQRANQESRRANEERERASLYADQAEQSVRELYVEQGRLALLAGDAERAFAYLLQARLRGADTPALRLLLARASRTLTDRLLVLPAGRKPTWVARFSPDGTRIATGSDDKQARIWDADSGELLRTLSGHDAAVWNLAFSPDGSQLVTAGWDGTVRSWDVATGVMTWSRQHGEKIYSVDFGRDGSEVITGSNGTARRWQSQTGDPLGSFEHGLDRAVVGASPDGDHLLAAAEDGTVRHWKVSSGERIATTPGRGQLVNSIAVSPDGALAAITDFGNAGRLVPVAGGPAVSLVGHSDMIYRVDFSPDGKQLVTASEDGTARIWDVATGDLLRSLAGHMGGVTEAAHDRRGETIFTASRDGEARAWDARSGKTTWIFRGHRAGLWSLELSPRGDTLLTTSFDGTVAVWSADARHHDWASPVHPRQVRYASSSPDGQLVATGADDGFIRVWNLAGESLAKIAVAGEARAAWRPDSAGLVLSGGEQAIVWDVASDRELLRIGDHGGRVRHAIFTPDGTAVITAGDDGTARRWNAETGMLNRTFAGHDEPVVFLDVSADGTRLVTASRDRSARVWSMTGRARPTELATDPPHPFNTARFSADGEQIIATTVDNAAVIWTTTGELVTRLEGHSDAVTSADMSRDGQLAVTGSEDGTLRVWDVVSGELLWATGAGSSSVWSVEISADGSLVTSGGGDTAKRWSITYDDRSPGELEAFASCRVGYTIANNRLERTERPHEACNRRQRSR